MPHVLERFLVGDVIHHDDAISTAVVGVSDGAEPLLPCRVPNLQLHCFILDFNGSEPL